MDFGKYMKSGAMSMAEDRDGTRITYKIPVSNRHDQNDGLVRLEQVRRKYKRRIVPGRLMHF